MAGVANDYLIYPILDLIREELRMAKVGTSAAAAIDPFAGIPEIELARDHPTDPDRVTAATAYYASGYQVQVYLTFGSDDGSTFPDSVIPGHPDFEYYSLYRLTSVTVTTLNPDYEPVASYLISLNYDDSGLLTGTSVNRL